MQKVIHVIKNFFFSKIISAKKPEKCFQQTANTYISTKGFLLETPKTVFAKVDSGRNSEKQ